MNFTLTVIDQGIAKLNNRIEELHRLIDKNIGWKSQEAKSTSQNIVRTIKDVFGSDSDEYQENRGFTLIPHYPPSTNHQKIEKDYYERLSNADILLKKLREWLEEKKVFINEDPTEKILSTFNELNLHPRIADVCVELFHNRHYRNAVHDAAIALVHMVQEKSHRNNLDGTNLMNTVFSKNSPILVFNKFQDQVDKDEQEGFMYLFKGATLGIRNPRSHALNPDDQQEALEFITFLSLLAKLVDKAKLQPHD